MCLCNLALYLVLLTVLDWQATIFISFFKKREKDRRCDLYFFPLLLKFHPGTLGDNKYFISHQQCTKIKTRGLWA